MAWIWLILAGFFEVGFAFSMGKIKTEGNASIQWGWVVAFVLCVGMSMYLLHRATQTIPIGTAYPVWTGIGAVGTILVGIVAYSEPTSPLRLLFLVLLVGSIIGLKSVS